MRIVRYGQMELGGPRSEPGPLLWQPSPTVRVALHVPEDLVWISEVVDAGRRPGFYYVRLLVPAPERAHLYEGRGWETYYIDGHPREWAPAMGSWTDTLADVHSVMRYRQPKEIKHLMRVPKPDEPEYGQARSTAAVLKAPRDTSRESAIAMAEAEFAVANQATGWRYEDWAPLTACTFPRVALRWAGEGKEAPMPYRMITSLVWGRTKDEVEQRIASAAPLSALGIARDRGGVEFKAGKLPPVWDPEVERGISPLWFDKQPWGVRLPSGGWLHKEAGSPYWPTLMYAATQKRPGLRKLLGGTCPAFQRMKAAKSERAFKRDLQAVTDAHWPAPQ